MPCDGRTYTWEATRKAPPASACQEAADSRGGNGFLTVAATHAALLPARCGGFPRASRPPLWTTYDPEVVRAALKRLDAARTP